MSLVSSGHRLLEQCRLLGSYYQLGGDVGQHHQHYRQELVQGVRWEQLKPGEVRRI